jgi:hypothetical protein
LLRLFSVNLRDPRSIYWCNEDLEKCRFFDFTAYSFDLSASSTPVQSGGSIAGWIFLSFPQEGESLFTKGEPLQIRLSVKNSHAEEERILLTVPETDPGRVVFGTNGIFVFPPSDFKDLSAYEIYRPSIK